MYSPSYMPRSTYKKALEQSLAEHRKLVKQREELDRQIASLSEQIVTELRLAAKKGEAVDVTRLFDEQEMPEDDEKASLTDAIGDLLKGRDEFLTASQIKEGLPRIGFDVSHYSDPLPTITTTLCRLVKNGDVISQSVSGRTVYKWNTSAFKHSPLKYLGQRHKTTGMTAPSKKAQPRWWVYMQEQAAKKGGES